MNSNLDLSTMVAGKELNPFAYNLGDYTDKSVLIDFIKRNKDKPAHTINLQELSKNGLAIQDEMSTYLSQQGYISSGNLKNALKSPRSFWYDYQKVFVEKNKPHFELGTFAHMAFLEPELFKTVVVAPDVNLASKQGILEAIDFYSQLNDVNVGCDERSNMTDLRRTLQNLKDDCTYQIVQPEHMEVINAINKNYYEYGNGIIKHLLKGGLGEVSFYGQDETTGLNLRVRPDFLNIEENIGVNAIISMKTTRAENLKKFANDAVRLSYDLSEGMYQEVISNVTGRKFDTTIMLMFQTVEPYDVAVLWWQPDDLQLGKRKFRMALDTVKDCFDGGLFLGFEKEADNPDGIIDFKLPEWGGIDDFVEEF